MSKLRTDDLVGRPAGIATRSAAYLLDLLIAFGSYAAIIVAGDFAWNLAFEDRIALDTQVRAGGLWTVGFLTYWVLYLWFWWGLDGASPGKALSGVRLVRRDGSSVGRFAALVRAVLYVLLVPPVFSTPFVILTRQRFGLHDIVCRTRVVYDWGARPVRPRARRRLRVRSEPVTLIEKDVETTPAAPTATPTTTSTVAPTTLATRNEDPYGAR